MSDVKVTGADDFLRLSKALKAAGRGELRKELNRGIKTAAKPLGEKAQDALEAAVPASLARRAGKTKHTVAVKTGRDPGVTIGVPYGKRGTGIGASNAQLLNRAGQIRHPLYGNRDAWFSTNVPEAQGWFDEAMRRNAPDVQAEVEKAMQAIIDKIVRDAK